MRLLIYSPPFFIPRIINNICNAGLKFSNKFNVKTKLVAYYYFLWLDC